VNFARGGKQLVKALKRMGSGERDLRTVKEGANGGEDGSQEDWDQASILNKTSIQNAPNQCTHFFFC